MGLMESWKGLFGRKNLKWVDRDCSFSDNGSVRCIIGGHKKSKFLRLISSQVNPIPFLYLRHPVKYFCPNLSGSAARVLIIH